MALQQDQRRDPGLVVLAPGEPLAGVVGSLVGTDPPVAFEFHDGSRLGPPDAPATIVVRSDDALRRIVTAPRRARHRPGLRLRRRRHRRRPVRRARRTATVTRPRIDPAAVARRRAGPRPARPAAAAPPPEEARPARPASTPAPRRGRPSPTTTTCRNDFYRLVLGPSMTYSCAVWDRPRRRASRQAQAAKHELICRKLGLRPGMRLLDVGCGWGAMVLHAATPPRGRGRRHHHLRRAGRLGPRAGRAEAGLGDRVEIRLQDYRDVADGPFDAISSIGMFEHVGPQPHWPSTSATSTGCSRPGAGC